MLGNFLIGLREGIEAALIVSILLGYLARTGRQELSHLVWRGVAGAVIFSIAIATVLQVISADLSEKFEPAFAGAVSFIAVGFVTWMIFWMKRASATIAGDLRNRFDAAAAAGSGLAISGMAFAAVAREGSETAVFFWAAAHATGHVVGSLVGLALGIGGAVIVGYLLFRSSKRIDIQRLFKVTSVLLVFVAAGVLSYGVAEWQEIGVLPGAERIVLDLSALLSDGSLAEILLGGVLNIHAHTSLLQVIGYMVFVGLVLPPVMRPTRVPSAVAASTPR